MTAKDFMEKDIYKFIRFVHANNNNRIHEVVKNNLDKYEVVRIRKMYHILFIEVIEK